MAIFNSYVKLPEGNSGAGFWGTKHGWEIPDFQMDASEDHLENGMNMGNISKWRQV